MKNKGLSSSSEQVQKLYLTITIVNKNGSQSEAKPKKEWKIRWKTHWYDSTFLANFHSFERGPKTFLSETDGIFV